MSLAQSITLSLALGFLMVGAHQTFTVGFFESYWLFMISLILLFVYNWIKKGDKEETEEKVKKKIKPKKSRKKRKKK